MRKKIKNKILILLLAITALFVFGGCSLTQGLEDVKDLYDLNPQVTYYSNGGIFEDSSIQKEMFYKIGGKAMNIGFTNATSSHKPNVSRSGYKLLGWYYVELDNDGNPIMEDGAYKLAEAVDFTQVLQEDEHWIIAAKWQALVGVKVMMVCEEGAQVEVGEAKDGIDASVTAFQNGDLIGELNYNSQDEVEPHIATPNLKFFTVKDNAFTFLGYFMDEACETPAPSTLQRGETDIVLYAKYLTGNWQFVSSANDVKNMFQSTGLGLAGNNYWLLNDIDCSSLTRAVDVLANFRGTLQGNGYKISNLKLSKTLSQSNAKAAVFGNLDSTARLENVTFDNLQVTYTMRTAMHAETYFVFLSMAEGAIINNVTMTGTLNTSGPDSAIVDNLQNLDGSLRYDHCLYGGYDLDSDYTGGGFTVTLTKVNDVELNQQ